MAYTWSGNKSTVKHAKHSWFIVRGTIGQDQFSLDIVVDVWLVGLGVSDKLHVLILRIIF